MSDESSDKQQNQYLIGDEGEEFIRDLLSKQNPKQAIETVQKELGRLHNVSRNVCGVFELTDLLDIQRNQLYYGVSHHLINSFVAQIQKDSQSEKFKRKNPEETNNMSNITLTPNSNTDFNSAISKQSSSTSPLSSSFVNQGDSATKNSGKNIEHSSSEMKGLEESNDDKNTNQNAHNNIEGSSGSGSSGSGGSSSIGDTRGNLITKKENFEGHQEERFENMLESIFPYIAFDELRPLSVAMLKGMDQIPSKFLNELKTRNEIFETLPIEIKRQVWQTDLEMFRKHVFSLLNSYLHHISSFHPNFCKSYLSLGNTYQTEPKKLRESNHVLKSILDDIGSSLPLYNSILHFCRTLFINTNKVSFCTFRYELLMSLHDNKMDILYKNDPCYYFAWWLDAWLRTVNYTPIPVSPALNLSDSSPYSHIPMSPTISTVNMSTGNTSLNNSFNTTTTTTTTTSTISNTAATSTANTIINTSTTSTPTGIKAAPSITSQHPASLHSSIYMPNPPGYAGSAGKKPHTTIMGSNTVSASSVSTPSTMSIGAAGGTNVTGEGISSTINNSMSRTSAETWNETEIIKRLKDLDFHLNQVDEKEGTVWGDLSMIMGTPMASSSFLRHLFLLLERHSQQYDEKQEQIDQAISNSSSSARPKKRKKKSKASVKTPSLHYLLNHPPDVTLTTPHTAKIKVSKKTIIKINIGGSASTVAKVIDVEDDVHTAIKLLTQLCLASQNARKILKAEIDFKSSDEVDYFLHHFFPYVQSILQAQRILGDEDDSLHESTDERSTLSLEQILKQKILARKLILLCLMKFLTHREVNKFNELFTCVFLRPNNTLGETVILEEADFVHALVTECIRLGRRDYLLHTAPTPTGEDFQADNLEQMEMIVRNLVLDQYLLRWMEQQKEKQSQHLAFESLCVDICRYLKEVMTSMRPLRTKDQSSPPIEGELERSQFFEKIVQKMQEYVKHLPQTKKTNDCHKILKQSFDLISGAKH